MADGPRFDVKICGLTTRDAVEAAIGSGASLIGFVFVAASPRALSATMAADLTRQLGERCRSVGLFAGHKDADVAEIARIAGLDLIQFHGTEDEDERARLVTRFPASILARGVRTADDLPRQDAPRPVYHLFDAKPPRGAAAQGGHGKPFDWSVLKDYHGQTPFLLAGGLTPDNVGDAVRACAALPTFAGVDVSSGVESSPGSKDPRKIAAFVAAARSARRAA